jgi:hypothetical protein
MAVNPWGSCDAQGKGQTFAVEPFQAGLRLAAGSDLLLIALVFVKGLGRMLKKLAATPRCKSCASQF